MEDNKLKTAVEEAAKVADTYGLAKGVKPENVSRRVASLVANGTDPLLARTLAIEAENTQVAKDGQTAKDRADAEERARKAIGEQVLKMTAAELVVFAEKNSIIIESGVTKKAEILAIVQAALSNQ